MRTSKEIPSIKDLEPFDACVTIGRSCLPDVPNLVSAEDVLEMMDKHDIAEALVQSNEARNDWPRSRGNEHLVERIAGQERLHPVWVITPPKKPDPKGCREFIEEMLAAGVRVARLMMGITPPFHWIWQDMCSALEEHRIPCLVDFTKTWAGGTMCVPEQSDLDGLRDICLAHPGLPIIISHACGGLGLPTSTIPLMQRVSNLLIDTTGLVDYWREVARDISPSRVVFASGMPFVDPSIFISNVQYAPDLNKSEKKMIYGDNLRRLMEGVR